MQSLRTPDERFEKLPDYNFGPHYLEVDDTDGGKLRVHYLDEGPSDAAPVLMMHGEPTWSFLYRKMIPIFTKAGYRAVAPDLVGFGKSDKLADRHDYTYQRHVDWMVEWLIQTDLQNITLVCQDWGGLIGLRLVAAMPERFARIVVANTALPTGDQPVGPAFASWQAFSQSVPVFDAGGIVNGGTTSKLNEAEIAAYNAPFPDESFKEGARQFPMLVPTTPDDPASDANRAAWGVLKSLDIPVLTAFGSDDKIMAGADKIFQKLMPGASGQDHTILQGGGHFLQEDVGEDLAHHALKFIAATT